LKHAKLWPSLDHIRNEFYPNAQGVKPVQPSFVEGMSRPSKRTTSEITAPVHDLMRRREALAARKFSSDWAPGRLVLVKILASTRPVLLDQSLGSDLWRCFMVAPECDWAGYEDILLEPDDEPFDPVCGMVQAWNVITIHRSSRASEMVLGELSPMRMSVMRAAAAEVGAFGATDDSSPGVIALRALNGGQTVLTGTPLEVQDVRRDYRMIYRQLASAISI
jgi:hypothetical protein